PRRVVPHRRRRPARPGGGPRRAQDLDAAGPRARAAARAGCPRDRRPGTGRAGARPDAHDRHRARADPGPRRASARGDAMTSHPDVSFDLVVRGGRVIDPARNVDATLDVGLRDGAIAALAPRLPADAGTPEVDARGDLVLPGLIDTHCHVYEYVT